MKLSFWGWAMKSGKANSNLVIALVVGAVVILGVYDRFFASHHSRSTNTSLPPASTVADVRNRLETMGYRLEQTSEVLGHSATYSRDFKTAKLKVDLSWFSKDLDSAMFDGYLAGAEFESVLGNDLLHALLADVDQVFACKDAALRAYASAEKQEGGATRTEGKATTKDGWEVDALEYMQFNPSVTEPTQLSFRVLVKRIPGY